jgi:hypothetical protein
LISFDLLLEKLETMDEIIDSDMRDCRFLYFDIKLIEDWKFGINDGIILLDIIFLGEKKGLYFLF